MKTQIPKAFLGITPNYLEQILLRQPSPDPVVLLGHDRSGTSWLGDILAAASELVYCYEPLNPTSGFKGDWNGWRQYFSESESNNLYEQIFDPVFRGHLPTTISRKKIPLEAWKRSIKPYRIFVKETGSVLAGEFFASRYSAQIVVIKRHPIAVALSNLRQGQENAEKWRKIIIAQKNLQDAYLSSCWRILENNFESNLHKMLAVVCATYKVLFEQCRKYNWLLVSYEDLCLNPEKESALLFEKLKLDFSSSVRSNIVKTSSQDKSGTYSRYRISKSVVNRWKQQISSTDIASLKHLYEQFEIPWYGYDSDWEIDI